MTLPLAAELAVGEIAEALILKNFDEVLSLVSKSRCSVGDLEQVLGAQTASAYKPPVTRWDIVSITTDVRKVQWSVFVPLWNDFDSSASDLQVRLTVEIVDGMPVIELDDILVP